MPVNFQPFTIQVVPRPFVVPAAHPPAYPLTIGSTIRAFAAPDEAMGWFSRASSLLAATEIDRVNRASPEEQFQHLDTATAAIENGINCLNIFLWTDPVSRATYRKWMSGPPVALANIFQNDVSWGGDEFGGSRNGFEVGWYVPNSNLPVIGESASGLIPKAARTKFRQAIQGVPNPNQFVPTVGFDLSTIGGEVVQAGSSELVNEMLVGLASNVQNRRWIIQGTLATPCAPGFAYPRVCQYIPGQVFGVGGFRNNQRVQGADWNRWDTLFAQAPVIGYAGTLILAEGPYAYIPFLRELVAGLLARTPGQIIQDSRAFVAYSNAEGERASGGARAFLAAATGASGDVLTQMVQSNAAAQAASTGLTSIGGALVAAGGYAAIVGLIAMAAGAAIQIVDRLLVKDVRGHGKDDLGRFKPVLERTSLSGDASADPPVLPGFEIPPPPPGAAVGVHDGAKGDFKTETKVVVDTKGQMTEQTITTFTPHKKSKLPWFLAALATAAIATKYVMSKRKNPSGLHPVLAAVKAASSEAGARRIANSCTRQELLDALIWSGEYRATLLTKREAVERVVWTAREI